MNSKIINIVFVMCLAVVQGENPELQKDSPLRVYLPREIEIKNDTITLGEIAIIRGQETLVTKAEQIMLGRISVPGQKIVIDKAMILSRLVSNGIKNSKITLTGAEKVTVKQQNLIIKSNEFIELASTFIKENPPANSIYQAEAVLKPKDLVIPGEVKDMKLYPRLVRTRSRNQVNVQIAVFVDGKQIGMRQVVFRLKYNCRRIVALTELRAGMPITAENTRIEEFVSNYPAPADWTPPYGLVAKHRIPANSVVHSNMIGIAQPEIIIKRNQRVVMRFERPGISITAIGQAMKDAGIGDVIKVRNIDSRRIVFAKVNEDGTVEPVY